MNQDLYLHGLIGGTNSNPSTPEPTPWERPADWLSVPDLVDGTHKIYALVKLVDGTDHNYVRFSSDQDNSDGFHVDWGDGTEEQAPSGDGSYSVEHYYDFDQISNDSLTSDGYKQAVITITSSTGFAAGLYSNFTDNRSNIILELKINSSTWDNTQILCEAEHIVIGQNAVPDWNSAFANFQQLKCISISETLDTCTDFSYMFDNCTSLTTIPLLDTSSGTNFGSMFYYCTSLTTIPLLDTSSGTNFSSMFSGCTSLTTIPLLDTSSGTNFGGMFDNCTSLTTIPLLDTSSGTNFGSMFYYCTSLTTIPLLDTSSGTNFGGMFYYCTSLTTIPLLDTSSGTNFGGMFYNCTSLTTIPLLDTSSGTNFGSMFSGCTSLTTIPLLDTSSGTNFSSMFDNCTSLTTIPLLDTSSGTNFGGMFYYCTSLTTIPLLDTSSGTNFGGMFYYCTSLTTIPLLDTSSGTNFSYMFYNCYALKILGMINIPNVDFSLAGSYLDRDQIVNIFNELSVGTSTITLSYKTLGQSNPEITNGDVEIATNKGWTVTS